MHLKILAVLVVAGLAAAQRRYYSLEDMPDTNFDCRDKILGGYYADPEANCQMFHVCVKIPGQGVQDFRFLCPNETVFDQENQICADSGDIDCESSGLYLENFDLYRIGSAQSKRPVPQIGVSKGGVLPLGPSTKSPILTNNVFEDDDFYLQKSETGDRRLHSKDLLRGSSSSNFFNNRNKGKDLEEDDEETQPKRPDNNNNNQFRPRPNAPLRPKTQYQSQFRKAETQAPTTTSQQPTIANQNQLNDKKRTKVAVRKLTRKRPEDEVEVQSQSTQQPSFPSYSTQATQKFGGDANSRYSTVSRPSSTPPTFGTSAVYNQESEQQQQQTQQNRFQNFKRVEQTTPAFFEASTTTGSSGQSASTGVRDTTPFSLLRNPIVAAGPSYNSNTNRGATAFQQSRQTTANYPQQQPLNGNYPTPTPNGSYQNQQQQQQINRQSNSAATVNYQQQNQQNRNNNFGANNQNRQQSSFSANNYQQQSQQTQQQQQQQGNRPASAGNAAFQQQNRQTTTIGTSGFTQQRQVNFQQQDVANYQQNRQQFNGNFQSQQNSQQAAVTGVNYQQQTRQQNQPQLNNANFQQQTQLNNGNFQQQNRQQTQQNNVNNFQQQAAPSTGTFQQQNARQQTSQQTTANFQQQSRQQTTANAFQQQQRQQSSVTASNNFQQQNRQQQQTTDYQQNRQTTAGVNSQNRGQQSYTNTQQGFNTQQNTYTNQQTYNAQGINTQQTNYNAQQNYNNQPARQTSQRQSFNRNYDEFDESDNQEFLKTAPTNNFRPSDINSLTSANYKAANANATKYSEVSTTKYITPTIVTTPRTTPAYDTPPARQSTAQPSNYYTPTVSTTQRLHHQQSPSITTTLSPSSNLPQRIYPSPTPSKTPETKDVAYDYAYYDDSSATFPDYGAFDTESDFSRTSQRTKSRLI